MTDDIVTRLRRIASLTGDISGRIIPIACTKAADEIEILRKERDYYRKMCSIIADKNFVANGQIHSLQSELKQLTTDRNPTK